MELHEVTQELFGPLAHLAGEWEGSDGMDFSFHHEEEATGFTPYMEKVQLKPFGPVDNGEQHLYGLDYRMAAWRMTELDQDPFHTEVGYWLYDAEAKILSRCFMVPRGSVLIASGQVEPDATEFLLTAERGSTTNGILSNSYRMSELGRIATKSKSLFLQTIGATSQQPCSKWPISADLSNTQTAILFLD